LSRKILFVCAVALLCVAALPGWAADLAVPGSYPSIQQAYVNASSGDRIVVSGTHTADAGLSVTIGISNITITSGATQADIRGMRLLINAQNTTLENLIIDGRSATGELSPVVVDIVTVLPNADNTLINNCRIVNPATRENSGSDAVNDLTQHEDPGSCIDIRTSGSLTIRNCDFVCMNYPSVHNIVGLHFNSAVSAVGPILIEDCDFQVERRGIDFGCAWSNITIQRCSFGGFSGASGSAAGVFLYTDDFQPDDVVSNLVIADCTFLGNTVDTQGWRGIYHVGGIAENVAIRNCTFPASLGGDGIYWRARGRDMTIENNVWNGNYGISMRFSVRVSTTSNLSGLMKKDPRLSWHNLQLINNDLSNLRNESIGIGENMLTGVVIENNSVIDQPNNGAIKCLDTPISVIIRNNHLEQIGDADNLAGIIVAGNDSVVSNNFMLDCYNGIIVAQSRGTYGTALADPHYDRRCHSTIFARNVIVNSVAVGIIDNSTVEDEGQLANGDFMIGRSAMLRYINNTIVNSGSYNMAIHGEHLSAYNNLFMGGFGAINDNGKAASPITTFDMLGFNLMYSITGAYTGPALNAAAPTTDVNSLLPPVVGGPNPTNYAGVALRPDSVALSAGTSNGIDPDYVTDIGAVQTGANVDTAVSSRCWELYR
jgi:hypothetical protein